MVRSSSKPRINFHHVQNTAALTPVRRRRDDAAGEKIHQLRYRNSDQLRIQRLFQLYGSAGFFQLLFEVRCIVFRCRFLDY